MQPSRVVPPMNHNNLTIGAELEKLQYESFDYLLHEVNLTNGLILDKTAAIFNRTYRDKSNPSGWISPWH